MNKQITKDKQLKHFKVRLSKRSKMKTSNVSLSDKKKTQKTHNCIEYLFHLPTAHNCCLQKYYTKQIIYVLVNKWCKEFQTRSQQKKDSFSECFAFY